MTRRRKFLLSFLGAGAIVASGAAFWPLYRDFGDSSREDFDSPNWRDGEFRNYPNAYIYRGLDSEPTASGGWLKFLLSRNDNRYPPAPVPSVKSNLKDLRDGEFVWLGHSSLLFRLSGKYVCVDPVLSDRASPIPGTIPAQPGSSPFAAKDFPALDFLCVTHDHWDHLDYKTVKSLSYKRVVCGLGLGSHLRYWGYRGEIIELDWNKSTGDEIRITYAPSAHFSGRGLKRNGTLWGGFIFDAGENGKVYFTGDGGYGYHFADIGKRYGPFDIIFPDSGQYNRAWPKVHMFPEQSVQSAIDSRARLACPVHRGKFALSWHPWNEPEARFSREAARKNFPFILPAIGEKFQIG